jgi:hypothetical protein
MVELVSLFPVGSFGSDLSQSLGRAHVVWSCSVANCGDGSCRGEI